MTHQGLLKDRLIRKALVRLFIFTAVILTLFFFSAGTFAFWEAWLYMAVVLAPTVYSLVYFVKNDPELLERRMRTRENEAVQKRIIMIFSICMVFTFLLPGLDRRFGWSDVPFGLVAMADIAVVIGHGVTFLVFKANRFASRVIEVESDQKVVRSGPYAIVRHPMYTGVLVMFLFSPLALGSYWALIPSILMIPALIARIRNEEKILVRDLEGYREYLCEVKYRLIPGVW